MNKVMKTCVICGSVLILVFTSGCQKETEVVPKEENVAIVQNNVYEAPKNPTQEQIKVYNELSDALSNHATLEKIASLVAINFAYDFFSLYNKTSKNDVGGLQYLPEEAREEFSAFASYKYYNNYDTVITQYSKDDLPNVILHEVNSTTASKLTYKNLIYDGFEVKLTLKYADSKLAQEALKTTMSVQVINNNGVLQVIAVED